MRPLLTFLFSLLVTVAIAGPATPNPGEFIAPADPADVFDPNDDGWSSSTGASYVSDDQSESEIGWAAIPQSVAEIDGDLNTGGGCGTTDIVDDPSSSADASYVEYLDPDGTPDNGDEVMIYRLRIAKDPGTGNFGFSVLIDTDEQFGNGTDPDYVAGNPGFEIEIRVVNGGGSKGVYLDSIGGTTSGVNKASYSLDTHAARSYALAQDPDCSGDPVFYDFYVPFTDLNTHFGIVSTTPLRIVGATSTNGTSVLAGNSSDIAGIKDDDFANSVAGQESAFSSAMDAWGGGGIGAASLPVEMVDFNMVMAEGVTTLSWSTSSELNNERFTIEHSIDGQYYQVLDQVAGNGTTAFVSMYSAAVNATDGYVRLVQYDYDGRKEVLAVRHLSQLEKSTKLNAVMHNERVSIQGLVPGQNWRLLNMMGQVIDQGASNDFSTVDLRAGQYLLAAQNGVVKLNLR